MWLKTHVFNVDRKDSDQTAFSYTAIFKLVNEFEISDQEKLRLEM